MSLFCGFHDLTHAPVNLLGHLFGGMAKQAAGVRKFYLAGGFRPDVLELELADQFGQGRVAVGAGFDSGFLASFIPAVAQHLLAHLGTWNAQFMWSLNAGGRQRAGRRFGVSY